MAPEHFKLTKIIHLGKNTSCFRVFSIYVHCCFCSTSHSDINYDVCSRMTFFFTSGRVGHFSDVPNTTQWLHRKRHQLKICFIFKLQLTRTTTWALICYSRVIHLCFWAYQVISWMHFFGKQIGKGVHCSLEICVLHLLSVFVFLLSVRLLI